MVLRIGYLQWHFRTHGSVQLPQPVLRDFRNIENRDALITYADRVRVTDDTGRPVTRWDGITTQTSPITGEPIPDESAQMMRDILSNKLTGARRDAVLLNTAAALAAETGDFKSALAEGTASLDSGKALEKLNALVEITRS